MSMAHIPDTGAPTPEGPVENTDAMMTRILIVDDHPLFREALESAVRMERPQCEIFEATTIDEALSVLSREKNIDLGLFDLFLPGTSGLSDWCACAPPILTCRSWSYRATRIRACPRHARHRGGRLRLQGDVKGRVGPRHQ